MGNGFEVGAVLDDKWRVDGVLGEGGMGTVLSAVHVRNGRRVALKLLHARLSTDPEFRERMRREAFVCNRVGHPGIVAALDDGVSPSGAPFIVLERLDGESLDVLADRHGGTLPLARVLSIAERWLEVMAAAHACGVIHRDIKPENLFVCRDGSIKVLDFGIAGLVEEAGGPRLTGTGVAMGTPAFMPPEQALAHWAEVDARSDVFGLAASIFTLLSGRLVHEAATVPEVLVRACTRPAPPVRSVARSIPEPLAVVLDRALRFRAGDRYRDAGEMLAALRAAAPIAAAASSPRSTMSTLSGPVVRPRERKQRLWWLAASIVLGCLVASFLYARTSERAGAGELPSAGSATAEMAADSAPIESSRGPVVAVPSALSAPSAIATASAIEGASAPVSVRPTVRNPRLVRTAGAAPRSDPLGWK